MNKEAVGFLNHDEMTLWSVSKKAESKLHLLISENAVECDLSNVITQKSVCTCCQRDGPASVFEAFIKELFEWYHQKQLAERCVFHLGNAPVHHKDRLEQPLSASGHILVFGAPYSPEMNPVEFMFGIWKRMVNEIIGTQQLTVDSIKAVLTELFYKFLSSSIHNLVSHVFSKVYDRVFNGEDIERGWSHLTSTKQVA